MSWFNIQKGYKSSSSFIVFIERGAIRDVVRGAVAFVI